MKLDQNYALSINQPPYWSAQKGYICLHVTNMVCDTLGYTIHLKGTKLYGIALKLNVRPFEAETWRSTHTTTPHVTYTYVLLCNSVMLSWISHPNFKSSDLVQVNPLLQHLVYIKIEQFCFYKSFIPPIVFSPLSLGNKNRINIKPVYGQS